MKLYTEEQIQKLITYLQNDYLDFSSDNLDFDVIEKDGFIQIKASPKNQKEELILTPIEIPELSDDEIEQGVNDPNTDAYDFREGAKWYREQLKQRQ